MTNSSSPFEFVASLIETAADEIEKTLKKEASNSTGGTWEPIAKEASNTTGGSFDEEEGEILNPFIEAQRVLSKVEQVANDLDDNAKAAALIEVAKIHSNIGQQLLEDFIR
jgi:hypothetical protein